MHGKRDRKTDSSHAGKTSGHKAPIPSRSLALFIGCFSLLNATSCLLGHTTNQNIWWIDFSFLSVVFGAATSWLTVISQILIGALLTIWSLRPIIMRGLRILLSLLCACLALAALADAITYWVALWSGFIYTGLPIPLSLLISLAFIHLSFVTARTNMRVQSTKRTPVYMAAGVITLALAFPLLQVIFFGTTDYRRSADAVIVLGAQVYPNGSLSPALAERMDTAIELHDEGLAPKIIVSGGIDVDGSDEAKAMRAYAISKGVSDDDIISDSKGDSTEATVENSLAIVKRNALQTILVTSSFYHLPRIKLMYRARGITVYTVPTIGDIRQNGTLYAIWREIPGWWIYWFKDSFVESRA